MKIELQFNTVQIDPQDMQKIHPNILSAISSYLPNQKVPKRRRPRRKKKLASVLIDEIIDSIEVK